MLDYVYGHDEIVAQFVAQLIPRCRERGFGAAKAIGVIEDGKLIAGMVYNNYNPDSQVIEMSGAALPGKQWLTRETLKRIYQYPFLQCGCQMVVMVVAAEDKRLLRILASLNYAFIKFPRLHGRTKDAVLCLLTYEDWATNKMCRRFHHHISEDQIKEAA